MSATILCVQQDRTLGAAYADALAAEGCEVLSVHDGRGAFETLRRHRPDLVVLDAYLPRQDGFEILAELRTRAATRDLPVVLLSEGDVTAEITNRARALGARRVESAPLSPDRLVDLVQEIVGKGEHDGGDASAIAPTSGDLQSFPFPELVTALYADAADGVLLVERGKKKKAIEICDGWPVSVKSNLLSETLGSYLVRRRLCTKAQLEESVTRMRAGEGLQGEILVAMDVLDEDAVAEALEAHAIEKLLDVFGWRSGRFLFRPGARVQRGSGLGVDVHPYPSCSKACDATTPSAGSIGFSNDGSAATSCRASTRSRAWPRVGLGEAEAAWLRRPTAGRGPRRSWRRPRRSDVSPSGSSRSRR
ncbi:MAG: response regulator [Myxococcota bacterium]